MERAAHARAHDAAGNRAAEALIDHVVHQRLVRVGVADGFVLRDLLEHGLRNLFGQTFAQRRAAEALRRVLPAAARGAPEERLRDDAVAHAAEDAGRDAARDESANAHVARERVARRVLAHALRDHHLKCVGLAQRRDGQLLDLFLDLALGLRAAQRAFRHRAGDGGDGRRARGRDGRRRAAGDVERIRALGEFQRRS